MARARNIKPGLFKNELLGVADPLLTILFQSLWCLADKAGRLEDRPLRIKAETFPYRENLDVNGYLTELERLGFIHRYVVEQMALIQVINFEKHQNPHKTEKDSELPEYSMKSDSCSITVKQPLNNGSRPADSLIPDSLIPDPLNLIQVKEKVPPSGETHEVFDYWKTFHNHPQAKLDDKRSRAIKARLKDGYSVGELCKAIEGCKYSEYHQGKNDSGTVYDDIELICRNATNVDKFIVLANKGPLNGVSQDMNKTISMLQQWVLEEENGES